MIHIYRRNKLNTGFTVVEMIIAISIVSILTSIVLFNYQGFQRNIDFSNTAQDIALLIKKAQSESIAGKYPGIGLTQTYVDTTSWKPSYGVFFDKQDKKIIYFFDRNNDGQFQSYGEKCLLGGSECLEEIILGQERSFYSFCVYADEARNGKDCSVPSLSFTFKRPFPDALIRYKYNPATTDPADASFGPGAIIITDPQVSPNAYSVFVSVLGKLSLTNEKSVSSF